MIGENESRLPGNADLRERSWPASRGVSLQAVLIGSERPGFASPFSATAFRSIHHVKHPALEEYAPDAWATKHYPAHGVDPSFGSDGCRHRAAGTRSWRWVGAMAGLPMAANCVEVNAGSAFRVHAPSLGRQPAGRSQLHGDPKLLTVAPRFRGREAGDVRTERL